MLKGGGREDAGARGRASCACQAFLSRWLTRPGRAEPRVSGGLEGRASVPPQPGRKLAQGVY